MVSGSIEQAPQQAGQSLNARTGSLSGQVGTLVPADSWGGSADNFAADWGAKARQVGQLAGVCSHVGRVLVDLAGKLETAAQLAVSARGPQAGVPIIDDLPLGSHRHR